MIRALLGIVVLVPTIAIAQSSVGELQRASDKAQGTHDLNVAVEEVIIDAVAVEEQPQFPGGEAAMFTYFRKNFRYPDDAVEAGIGGKIFLEFVIRATGQVTDVVVKRGANPSLDAEAVRVVKSMPWWTPGKQDGKPVAVRFTFPINCVLPK